MNGDLITGAAGVDGGGHLIGKQVKTPPGELDAGQREHPGELAGHIHLLGFAWFHLENLLMQETLEPGSLCWEKLLSVTGEKTNM